MARKNKVRGNDPTCPWLVLSQVSPEKPVEAGFYNRVDRYAEREFAEAQYLRIKETGVIDGDKNLIVRKVSFAKIISEFH